MSKIFIQIASYRDPELVPTIESCLENAEHPENIVFGICWQYSESDSLGKYLLDPRFKIIVVHYSHSKGCCWARNKLQQLYDNEEYTLQLDSHHRFVKRWDTILKEIYIDLQKKGNKKPIITTYPPSYFPETDPIGRQTKPNKLSFKSINENFQVESYPDPINDYLSLDGPIPSQFYAAGFAFTSGDFVLEVPHDPNLYFKGEEMNIAIRAYTKGYVFFNPHIIIVWHYYTRKKELKHWTDHKDWGILEKHSKNYYLKAFENFEGIYGLGKERTIDDYINETGIQIIPKKQINDSTDLNNKKIDDSWRKWIKENLNNGCKKKTIKSILLKSNFDIEEIENELK